MALNRGQSVRVTADGATDSWNLNPGQPYDLSVAGTFDGASVAVEWARDTAGPWIAVESSAGVAFAATTAVVRQINLGSGHLRANISSAGASTVLTIALA